MQYPLVKVPVYCYCDSMDVRGFPQRLKRAREARGIGSYDLSRRIGRGGSYISMIETGARLRDAFPAADVLEAIARELQVSIDYLMGKQEQGTPEPSSQQVAETPAAYDEETARLAEIGRQVVGLVQGGTSSIRAIRPDRTPGVSIPVINAIAADRAQSESSQLEDRLEVPTALLHGAKKPVAFRVAGDCLALRGIVTGDHLIVDTANSTPRNGQIVAARLNGEDTAKIYCRIDARTVELQPSLPDYPTLRAVEGSDELTIIGTFVAVWPTGRRD